MNMVSIAVLLVVTTNCFRHFKAIQRRIRINIPHFPPHFLHICRKYTLYESIFSENMIKK